MRMKALSFFCLAVPFPLFRVSGYQWLPAAKSVLAAQGKIPTLLFSIVKTMAKISLVRAQKLVHKVTFLSFFFFFGLFMKLRNGDFFFSFFRNCLFACYRLNLCYCIHSLPFPLSFFFFFCARLLMHVDVWRVNNRRSLYTLTVTEYDGATAPAFCALAKGKKATNEQNTETKKRGEKDKFQLNY